VDPRRAKWWWPKYTAFRRTRPDGQKQWLKEAFYWSIPGVRESECPVSLITQKSFELVEIVNQMQGAFKSTGSTVGADEMPGYLLDAVRVCQSESISVDNAMDEAANE